MSGYGKMIYANNDIYVGFWYNNQRNGYGIMIKENKDVFEGKWVKIRGEIELFKGKPQIKLEEPSQIAVVEKPEPKPVEVVEKPQPAPAVAEPEPQPEPEPPLQTEPKTAVAPRSGDVELIDGKPPVDWRLYFKE